ncbi:UDP-N-acetylmuramate--L-alanine ligase [bacterium]|nr:UDP-N-acetylmuramate--L-alanine ligase [bacterium]
MIKQSTKRIHFIGIGGAGVSALARLMLQMGKEVTGSDCSSSSVTEGLKGLGATVWLGHDERYARQADMVVYSTAVKPGNPELDYAREKGMTLLTRIEMLSYLASRQDSIVVSGSHGKSTTSSMIATAFIAAEKDPTIVLGSELLSGIGSARLGKSKVFICEGDESNNSILEFKPRVSVVTNIDCDHMDFHGSLANLKDSFIRFLNAPNRSGYSVVCSDDENIRSILPKLTGRVVTYGFNRDADYQAQGRRLNNEGGISFEVHHKTRGPLGEVELRFPGDHNVLNALATVAVCLEWGLSLSVVSMALWAFPGVHRRYERIYEDREMGLRVIDDYAHHPSEIMALLKAAREVHKGRMRAIFQPHRYTRSKNLATEFPPAFALADEIILAPIYTANEPPIAGIGVDYLNRFFQEHYKGEMKLKCMRSLEEISEYLQGSTETGDMVLTVGAGNIDRVAYELRAYLEQRKSELSAPIDLERLQAGISMNGDFEEIVEAEEFSTSESLNFNPAD